MSIEAATAAHRFGLGPRPDELASLTSDPRSTLLQQLSAPAGRAEPALATTSRLIDMWHESLVQSAIDNPHAVAAQIPLQAVRRGEQLARIRRSIETPQPLRERLVQFWSNHFAVSTSIVKDVAFAGVYEREAIAPHVTGKFIDLLRAAELHPAMLFYLDQSAAMGPDSRTGRRLKRGANENLAREIMELHTLGVDGGYDQADVQALAAVLTGWHVPVESSERQGFFESFHEPGAKRLLGTAIPEGGEDETEAAFTLLSRHPSTARHVATKLARHFVTDEPPPEVIDILAKAFRDTDGDLAAVYAVLIGLEQAWAMAWSKVKTPWELTVALGRACAGDTGFPDDRTLLTYLKRLGHEPFVPNSPAGYPDKAVNWLGGEAILIRLDLIRTVVGATRSQADMRTLLDRTLGGAARPETIALVAQAPTRQLATTLLFASSEFQRR